MSEGMRVWPLFHSRDGESKAFTRGRTMVEMEWDEEDKFTKEVAEKRQAVNESTAGGNIASFKLINHKAYLCCMLSFNLLLTYRNRMAS